MKTKKILALILAAALALSLAACGSAQTSKDKDGLIKVGIVNNPPSESGYRAANVADFEKVSAKQTDIRFPPSTASRMTSS